MYLTGYLLRTMTLSNLLKDKNRMEPEAVKELVKQDETGMLPNARDDYQSPNPSLHIPDP